MKSSSLRHGSNIRSDIKIKFEKIFLLLSKTLRVNETAMKCLSKICRSESTLNCRYRHLCIKLTHTIWVVWEVRSQSCLKGCNDQLCIYVTTQSQKKVYIHRCMYKFFPLFFFFFLIISKLYLLYWNCRSLVGSVLAY